jgi:pimeloyl-ACP methyl ester carboxylesterase
MLSLGYERYVAQGGDWGSIITRMMGRYHEENLRAVHVNLAAVTPKTILWRPLVLLQTLFSMPFWTKSEKLGLKNGQEYTTDGNAYYNMHMTRPQTVAYCLTDSPVALLGWIYEKLVHWTDDYPWTNDEVLTWISVYWFSTAGPGASVRTYFEAHDPSSEFGGGPTDQAHWASTNVPLGITQFPRDIVGIPKVLTQMLGNVVFQNWGKDGGHFAAWERPEVIADDLRVMFKQGGGAFGIGEGKKSI